MKKLLAITLALTIILSLAACGGSSEPVDAEEPTLETPTTSEPAAAETAAVFEGKIVGISMPTEASGSWASDSRIMLQQLEALGYQVELTFADNDVQTQVSQIEGMIASEVDCLVITAVDSVALTGVEEQAKAAGIPIIAYDKLLMYTDAVSYCASFNNEAMGRAIAEYVEAKLDLAGTAEIYTMELFMGSPLDNDAQQLYKGVMKVLQKYLDNGTLVCNSGLTALEDTGIENWTEETARQVCRERLAEFYADEDLDICLSVSDVIANGCAAALEDAGYSAESGKWPIITGLGGEETAVKNILSGHQTMTIVKDTPALAAKCAALVHAVLTDSEPEINDFSINDNGVLVVPSYLGTYTVLDAENMEG